MKKWKKSEIVFLILMTVIIIAAACVLFFIFREYHTGSDTYESLQSYVFLPEETPEPPSDASSETESGTQPSQASPSPDSAGEFYLAAPPVVDFDSLRAINPDCIGWIYSPNTSINYPIAQGTDNSYYLDHMYNGAANACGAIFMDYLNQNDFTDHNSILYGHHMKNGSMFAGLAGYAQQDYYDAHPALWIITPGEAHRVNLFAGFVTDAESDVWQVSFANDDDFQKWLDSVCRKSYFKSDIVPTVNDHIVTLATCSYETATSRFVVMGIME